MKCSIPSDVTASACAASLMCMLACGDGSPTAGSDASAAQSADTGPLSEDGGAPSDAEAGALDDGSAADAAQPVSCEGDGVELVRPPTVLWWVVNPSSAPAAAGELAAANWGAFRNGLLGFAQRYEGLLAMVLHGGDPAAATCPSLSPLTPQPASQARMSLMAALPEAPAASASGFTGYALGAVRTGALALANHAAVLVLRGHPEATCPADAGADARARVGQQIGALAGMGVRTTVIADAWAGADPGALADAASLATAGGWDVPLEVRDQASLDAAFTEVARRSESCVLVSPVDVPEQAECSAEVTLDGRVLRCGPEADFRWLDTRRVELLGEACDALRSAPGLPLTATVPCSDRGQ